MRFTVSFDEKKVDEIFAELDQSRLPGAAVGIAVHGRPVYRKGFGVASMELPVILSPGIRMRIASISKHFVSLAFMLLCEEGKAGIDDPVRAHLPELHPVTHAVTMRQLMGNTGGLHDSHEISCQFSGTETSVTSAELLSLYRSIDQANAAPGTVWIYNNGGFLILSSVVERISRQPLEEFLRERIFDPAGMYATLLRRSDKGFVPNSATAHMTSPAGGYEKSNYFGIEWAGEGGIVSTVDDMLRWLAQMDAPVIGSAETWKTLREPQTLINGTSTGYGLGLIRGNYRGIETLYHPGGGMGSSAQMLKACAVGLDVVVMVNREDVHAMVLAERILDACLEGLDDTTVVPSSQPSLGVFRSPTTARVVQLLSQDGRQIASIDGMEIPVAPDEEGVLWPAGIWRYMKLAMTLVGDRAQPIALQLSDFGNVDELVPAPAVTSVVVDTIAGIYHSEMTNTEARIADTPEGSRLFMTGSFGSVAYRLECLADGVWRAKSMRFWYFGGILSFDASGSEFKFFSSTCRMRALAFRRG